MRALFKILAGLAGCLLIAASISVAIFGREAIRKGSNEYRERRLLQKVARREDYERPQVVWMGDSTLMRGTREIEIYPRFVADRLAEDHFVETRVFAQAAVDPYINYCVIGELLETSPDVVMIVANLRIMALRSGTRGFLSMASFIPPKELPRAIWLPWHLRQATIPRVLLAQGLRLSSVEQGFYLYEGLREMFREELYSEPIKLSFRDRFSRRAVMLSNYAEPISPEVIRMLAAAVDMSVRGGARTVVVVTPIPVDELRKIGRYGAQPKRIEAIRTAVESAGGRMVDLHDAISASGFRDNGGHFTEEGSARVAELLEPVVREELAHSWPIFRSSAEVGQTAAGGFVVAGP